MAVRELEAAETQVRRAAKSVLPARAIRSDPAPVLLGSAQGVWSGLTVGGVLSLQRAAGNCATSRMLGRLACPDGSCGVECACEEKGESAAPTVATRLGPAAKAMGGEAELTGGQAGARPEIVGDPSAGVPDTRRGGETDAQGPDGAPAATAQPAAAPTDPAAVDTEVIDESPDEDVDDGPVPEADETPELGTSSYGTERLATKTADALNLGSAEPSRELGSDGAAVNLAKCGVKASSNMTAAAAASIPLGATQYGLTFPEAVDVKITACRSGATWVPGVTKLTGRYSLQIRLLPGDTEVTGPKGNTTSANFCSQVVGLDTLGNTAGNPWYMLRAVKKHEQVHKSRFVPALKAVKAAIVASIEAASVPHVAGMTTATAIAALQADPAFKAAVAGAQALWLAEILTRTAGDHAASGPADVAEHLVVDPMVSAICKTAKAKKWAACATCPP